MVEYLENTKLIVGVIIGLFSLLSTLIIWFDRRQKRFAEEAVKSTTGRSDVLAAKVDHLEGDVGNVAGDVATVRDDLSRLSKRVYGVEKSLETVARQSDVAGVNAELKLLTGTVTAENRALMGMMHSFRESAYRAAEKGTKE